MFKSNSVDQRSTQVKGMTMHITKQLDQLITTLVSTYANYDEHTDSYVVDLYDVADFDLNKLANLIMSSDTSLANEATGCDNPHYYSHMLPALQQLMMDSTNPDNTFDFANAWQQGITNYFMPIMQELLDKECSNRVVSRYDDSGRYSHINNNSNLYWRA